MRVEWGEKEWWVLDSSERVLYSAPKFGDLAEFLTGMDMEYTVADQDLDRFENSYIQLLGLKPEEIITFT